MMRLIPIFCVLMITACAKDQHHATKQRAQSLKHHADGNSVSESESSMPSDELQQLQEEIPLAAKNWDADIFLVNFDEPQQAKIQKAVKLIKKVISSKEFKERILNYQFEGKKQFHDNGGLTNEQIYSVILAGAEQMGDTSQNNVMNVELELYNQATSTIGYTYPNTVRIWMNRKYFDRYTPIKVADNLMHEWMHKLGFEHATVWSENRDHSVPYAVGYLVEELAQQYQ